jgi:type IV pilus assembly protein PilW
MRSGMRIPRTKSPHNAGFTLVEMMVVTGILSVVILTVTSFLLTSSKAEGKTVRRAKTQADARQTVYLMSTEIRQAGADPSDPPVGIVGLVSGDSLSIHVRSDLNGNGTIETVEPSEDVTYAYDSTAKTITRNPGGGAAIVMRNVTSMSISYFDETNTAVGPLPLSATDAARVHSVGLSVTAQDKDSQAITLTNRIMLRNVQ